MLKKISIVVGVLIGIILILGLVAPKDFKIEREILINKPKDQVFTYLKSLKNSNAWNPWMKLDPNIKDGFRGNDGEVGSVHFWDGNNDVGSGEQEIKSIAEGSRIDFELRFFRPMEGTSTGYYSVEPTGEIQTKVKWAMEGHNKFPMNVMCLVLNMTSMMNKQFDEGLASLKGILEK